MKRAMLLVLAVVFFFAVGMEGAASAAPKWKVKFGHDHKEDSPHHQAALMFKKKIEEATKGEIEFTVHPNGLLGTGIQMVEMVQALTLRHCFLGRSGGPTSTRNWSSWRPTRAGTAAASGARRTPFPRGSTARRGPPAPSQAPRRTRSRSLRPRPTRTPRRPTTHPTSSPSPWTFSLRRPFPGNSPPQ